MSTELTADSALRHIGSRLQMNIDAGDRPDQWSMEDLVRIAHSALAASPQPAAQPEPSACARCGGLVSDPVIVQQPEPGGLTEERIVALGNSAFGIDPAFDGNLMRFARAIEREVLSTTRKRTAEQNARIMEAVDRCAASSRRDEKDRLKGASEETNRLWAEVERLLRGEA